MFLRDNPSLKEKVCEYKNGNFKKIFLPMTIFRNLVARCQSPEAEFIAVKCNIPRKFSALTNGQFDKLVNDMKMYLSDCAERKSFPIEFDKVWRWVGYSHAALTELSTVGNGPRVKV